MRFYFPDSQDQIDPGFDFEREAHPKSWVRQRTDRYAHETLDPPPYSGLLVSKAMIDRHGTAGRYSAQQRQRFYREGVRDFFRLDSVPGPRIETLGDCGAFTYLNDEAPPFSTDEVIEFYQRNGFDAGVSVDHLIPAFEGAASTSVDPRWQRRFDLTLELAEEFFDRHRERGCDFEAVGVAQGWSAASYAAAVERLQEIGYSRIAIGGLVPLKTGEIAAVLDAIGEARIPGIEFHLFGVTRFELVPKFDELGVTSFDTTSPFRRAFKDGVDNYYVLGDGGVATKRDSYVALRVPQIEGNAKLKNQILAGEIAQNEAREKEQASLMALRGYDRGEVGLEEALEALCDYQWLHSPSPSPDRTDQYRRTLADAPWQDCDCAVCRSVGVEVVMFRGSERNKRRGFHNMHVFAKRLEQTRPSKLPLAA